MSERRRGSHEKEGPLYVPKYGNLFMDVELLMLKSGLPGDETRRKLLSLTDGSPSYGFIVKKSKAFEEGVSIMDWGKDQPVIDILLGASGTALVGISRTPEQLKFWRIPYKEIGSDEKLGEAVRKIVFSEVEPEIYPLRGGIKPLDVVVNEEAEKSIDGFGKTPKNRTQG